MNNIEIAFFEEYKKLDNLCKDVLNSEKGVTDYIEEMERTPYQKSSLVPSWERDYKDLKHVRWVRNDIAHGNEESECDRNDIDFVRQFYKRIMNQTDPFSMIRKAEKSKRKVSSQPVKQPKVQSRDNSGNAMGWVLLMGIFLLIAFCFVLKTIGVI
jgi:hypothetical protein